MALTNLLADSFLQGKLIRSYEWGAPINWDWDGPIQRSSNLRDSSTRKIRSEPNPISDAHLRIILRAFIKTKINDSRIEYKYHQDDKTFFMIIDKKCGFFDAFVFTDKGTTVKDSFCSDFRSGLKFLKENGLVLKNIRKNKSPNKPPKVQMTFGNKELEDGSASTSSGSTKRFRFGRPKLNDNHYLLDPIFYQWP